MSTGDLLHVAHPRQCNTQQTGENMQQRVQQPCNKPTSLKALAEGILSKGGRNSAYNTDATTVLHSPSPESAELQQEQLYGPEYTLNDLAEMDRLIHQIARLEGWAEQRLERLLDERRRMAPRNVISALRRLRQAHQAVLDGKPCPEIRLCVELAVIEGGKSPVNAVET